MRVAIQLKHFLSRNTDIHLRSVFIATSMAGCLLASLPAQARCSYAEEDKNLAPIWNLCWEHIGCRYAFTHVKTCEEGSEFLQSINLEIGEGRKTFFGYKKEITAEAVFNSLLKLKKYENSKTLGNNSDAQSKTAALTQKFLEVENRKEIIYDGESKYTPYAYYGSVSDGKANGPGIKFFSNGEILRGDFSNNFVRGLKDMVYTNGRRFVGADQGSYSEGILLLTDGTIENGKFYFGQKFIGEKTYSNGSKISGTFHQEKLIEGKKYRPNGSLLEEGTYADGSLSVGARFDDTGNRTVVDIPANQAAVAERKREEIARADQLKRDETARAEKQFQTSLQSMNAGQLFARADELNAQGDQDRARQVQRTLVSRFPDHPLAAMAAKQMSGNESSNATGGLGARQSAAGGRISSQACRAIVDELNLLRPRPLPGGVTSSLETTMYIAKLEMDFVDGGCTPNPGITPAQVVEHRKLMQRTYDAAEKACTQVQSGGRKCIPQVHVATQTSPAPRASTVQQAQPSYDPLTGKCLPENSPECRQVPASGNRLPPSKREVAR